MLITKSIWKYIHDISQVDIFNMLITKSIWK